MPEFDAAFRSDPPQDPELRDLGENPTQAPGSLSGSELKPSVAPDSGDKNRPRDAASDGKSHVREEARPSVREKIARIQAQRQAAAVTGKAAPQKEAPLEK